MSIKISTPIGIGIILILAVLVGGYTLWQFSEIQKEEIGPISLENKKQTTDFEETAQNLFSDYLDKYKNTDVSLNERIKSYMINDIKIDMIEDDCFGFTVNYSVETLKDQNNNWTNWAAGNGKEDGNWVKNKTNFVDAIKENGNYKIRETGTGRGSASCMGEQNETAHWGTYWNEEYGYEIRHPNDWEFTFSEGKVASIEKLNCSLLIYKTTQVYTDEKIKDCVDMIEKYGQGYCLLTEKIINDINFKVISSMGGRTEYFVNKNNEYFNVLLSDSRYSFSGGEPIPEEYFDCEPYFNQMLSTFWFFDKIKTGKVNIDYGEIAEIQKSVDEGHQPWRLNPVMVAMSEAYLYGFAKNDIKILSIPDAATQNKFGTEITKINLEIAHGSKAYIITLIQPIAGVGKIWTISEIELKPM